MPNDSEGMIFSSATSLPNDCTDRGYAKRLATEGTQLQEVYHPGDDLGSGHEGPSLDAHCVERSRATAPRSSRAPGQGDLDAYRPGLAVQQQSPA